MMIDYRANPFYLDDEGIEWVETTLASMSIEEKAGQLFCMNVEEFSDSGIEKMYRHIKPGGVAYRKSTIDTLVHITHTYNKYAEVPLLIAANLERGGNTIEGGTQVASPLAIGATGNEKMAERLGIVCAEEGKSVGINWAFGPLIDIDVNYRNPIVNTRTFGADPEMVEKLGSACVTAMQDRGMAACVKHFPGDGRDGRDQHLHPTINDCSCEEWDRTYGKIYKSCIDAGVLSCMVGHIELPAYSMAINPALKRRDCLPATLSKELLQGLLRKKLGFNGLIITDASTMGGFSAVMARKDAVPYSIASGADMFLFVQNLEEDFSFMLDGISSGVITQERLDEAVRRILAVKCALGLHKHTCQVSDATAKNIVGCKEHIQWAKECADEAITLVKEEKGVLPLNPKEKGRILLFPVENKLMEEESEVSAATAQLIAGLRKEGMQVKVFDKNMSENPDFQSERFFEDNFDCIFYVANLPSGSNQTNIRIKWVTRRGIDCPHHLQTVPTVFISLENPYHLEDVPRIKTFINTYASNPETIEVLIDKLMGRSTFRGKSPVNVFCDLEDTHF